jgi:hypothetical protein
MADTRKNGFIGKLFEADNVVAAKRATNVFIYVLTRNLQKIGH